MRVKTLAALAVPFVLLAGNASAQTATGNFEVRMVVEDQCTLESTETLDFGTTGVWTANIDGSANLVVKCTNGTAYNIGLDFGNNGTSASDLKMSNGAGGQILYGLYQDSGYSMSWGNTVGATYSGTGTGSPVTVPVYGRVPPPTGSVMAGTYTDTITVTVTY